MNRRIFGWSYPPGCSGPPEVDDRVDDCIDAAIADGHTEEEACNCEGMKLGCPNCPYDPKNSPEEEYDG